MDDVSSAWNLVTYEAMSEFVTHKLLFSRINIFKVIEANSTANNMIVVAAIAHGVGPAGSPVP